MGWDVVRAARIIWCFFFSLIIFFFFFFSNIIPWQYSKYLGRCSSEELVRGKQKKAVDPVKCKMAVFKLSPA